MNYDDPNEYYLDRFKNPLLNLIFKRYRNIITLETLKKKIKKENIDLDSKFAFRQISLILINKFMKIMIKSYTCKNFIDINKIKNKNLFNFEKEIEDLEIIFFTSHNINKKNDVKDNLKKFYILNDQLKNIEKRIFFLKDLIYIMTNTALYDNHGWIKLFRRGCKKNIKINFLYQNFKKFIGDFRGYFLMKTSNKKLSKKKLMQLIFLTVPILKKLNKHYKESNYEELKKILTKKPFLLKYKFPLSRYDTIFHLAIEDQKEELIEILLKIDKNCIHLKNIEGMNPLFTAIRSSNLKTIKLLIKKGVNINEKDKKKNNINYTSKMFSKEKITKYLIEKNCEIKKQN